MHDPVTVPEHHCGRGEHCADATVTREPLAVCGQCTCHNGPHHPCSIEGGCGHLHTRIRVRVPAVIPAARGVCVTCTRILRDRIAELPGAVAALRADMLPGSTVGEKVSSTRTPPAPLRVGYLDLADGICADLDEWAAPVAERLNIDWPTYRRGPEERFWRAAHLLTESFSVLVALGPQPVHRWDHTGTYGRFEDIGDGDPMDGVDAAIHLGELHRRADIVLGRTELVHRLPAPCPSCEALTLVRRNGASEVACERCRETWSETDYRRLTLILASTPGIGA